MIDFWEAEEAVLDSGDIDTTVDLNFRLGRAGSGSPDALDLVAVAAHTFAVFGVGHLVPMERPAEVAEITP